MSHLFKISLALVLLFGSLQAVSYPGRQKHHYPEKHLAEFDFNIHKRDFTLSVVFEIESHGQLFSHAIKRKYYLRTCYELYDGKGEYVGQAIHRFFPSFGLGWVYSWAADIDIYDKEGNPLGMIDGTVFTEATAKFNFYNAEGEYRGVAYMDRDKDSFVITDPMNPSKRIAELTRHCVKFQVDYWTVRIFDESVLPLEVLQTFAIFACDRQEKFLEDD